MTMLFFFLNLRQTFFFRFWTCNWCFLASSLEQKRVCFYLLQIHGEMVAAILRNNLVMAWGFPPILGVFHFREIFNIFLVFLFIDSLHTWILMHGYPSKLLVASLSNFTKANFSIDLIFTVIFYRFAFLFPFLKNHNN